jgi:membrane-bound metal-dependent hydrolase YbcI (DUF457 family)
LFIGHYAVAFAAKRASPRVSLGVLVGAASLLDLLWPVFLLLGWEAVRIEPGNTALVPLAFVHYPFSHSLVAAAGWSAICGLVYWGTTRYRSGAAVVGLVALSHWCLDALVHRPDLPLYAGSPLKVGLGLWNSIPASVLLESLMFAGGVWLYAAGTSAKDVLGRYLFIGFVGFLALAYAANVLGPPPPGWQAVAWVGLASWLFPFWAEWFDRHRAR